MKERLSESDGLAESRAETDRLFGLLTDGDLMIRPLPQRHRLIFYLGHLEAFDWNQAGRLALGEPHIEKSLDQLFARGIDPEPGQLPADQPSDWPSVEQAYGYVAQVRERLDEIWSEVPPEIQQTAIEHRWMHAETLAYQLHNLPFQMKRKPAVARESSGPPPESRFLTIPAGKATMGRRPGTQFGWDNEFNEFSVNVPEFSVAEHKVTNAEYLEFVNQGHPPPFFWTREGDRWFYRGMFESLPLPLNAPVYATQTEATEYAKWRGADVMTEAQFHRAAYGTTGEGEREYPWGDEPGVRGNFDFRHWDPTAVTEDSGGRSAFGVAQLVGNGWEWTKTPFGPFPGFQPRPNYPGYSADFFDDSHFVLKGASPRTAKVLTRRSLRNWFRPEYPYLYATFRLVEN
jgi:formylglycine-generating enzyme required for sulfatase activity